MTIREHLTVDEHAFLVCMERVKLPTGADLVLADVSESVIELLAYAEGSGDPIYGTVAAIEASDTITDTLQLTAPWDRDTQGYNFRHEVDGDLLFTDGGQQITLEFVIHTEDHGPIRVVKHVTVRGVRSR